MKNQVQLITYVDRLSGGGFQALRTLIETDLKGIVGGVHALPFFDPIDGADAGFDPSDHTVVDPRLGTWSDVLDLSASVEVMADMIVNHVSADSPAFRDFLEKGDQSEYADMFLTFDKVFPDGATSADLLRLYRPRPGFSFTPIPFSDGSKRLIWTTFTPQQIDIDVHSQHGSAYLERILDRFASAGISAIRLDAAGYAIKKAGTSCFMIPETYTFLETLAQKARTRGMEVLVEIHSYYLDQIDIARKVDMVYDFALPPLVLHALFTGEAKPLAEWLKISPRNAVTVLDTHDGIGVIDVGRHADGRPGLLTGPQIDNLVETMHARTNGESRKSTAAAANNLDLYQVNTTYYDALGQRDEDYLIARALQFFAPGVPQVYYVGLLGGTNDMVLLEKTHNGRDINRHYYTASEIETALKKPVVQRLFDLIRLRNTHPAFDGGFTVTQPSPQTLTLTWENGADRAELSVDFKTVHAEIRYSQDGGAGHIVFGAAQ